MGFRRVPESRVQVGNGQNGPTARPSEKEESLSLRSLAGRTGLGMLEVDGAWGWGTGWGELTFGAEV